MIDRLLDWLMRPRVRRFRRCTRSLAVASDDPEDLVARLLAPDPAGAGVWSLAWTAELATLARDAAQPG